jgi:uncharacterized membrane protein YczE
VVTTAAAAPAGRPGRPPIVRTVLWPTGAQWRARAPRLVVGLAIIAIGVALMVQAELGIAPYEVLNQGVSVRTPLTIGQASIVIGLGVLLLWFPLRQRPGFGTLANILGVGLMLDAWLLVVPVPQQLWLRLAFSLVGVVLVGVGIGLYIGAGLGPGPRDGLMTGLAEFGAPVWAVRLALESSALLLGWYLGGTVGFGTVAFALGVPFLADWSLRRFSVREETPRRSAPPSTRG